VLGADGLSYFLQSALGTVMDLRVQLSSCVPATGLETSGARLTASDLVAHLIHFTASRACGWTRRAASRPIPEKPA
jgi:adenine deaminase